MIGYTCAPSLILSRFMCISQIYFVLSRELGIIVWCYINAFYGSNGWMLDVIDDKEEAMCLIL